MQNLICDFREARCLFRKAVLPRFGCLYFDLVVTDARIGGNV